MRHLPSTISKSNQFTTTSAQTPSDRCSKRISSRRCPDHVCALVWSFRVRVLSIFDSSSPSPFIAPAIDRLQRNNPRRRRRRPLPPDQMELSRQNVPLSSHRSVTINPRALELLKSFHSESTNGCSSSNPSSLMESNLLSQSESDKATQTYTRVSVGTECCSLNNAELGTLQSIPTRRTEQKSSQTQGRIRIYKRNARYSSKRTTASTITDDVPVSVTFHNVSTDVFNASTMTNWDNVPVTDMQTQISSSSSSDRSIQTVGAVSNILHDSSEQNHSVIVQTLPISMKSTQMQTTSDYLSDSTTIMPQYPNYLPPYQESVGTSCFLDEFLLDDFTKADNHDSSVLFDFDAMDLLDLIDNGTQTHPLISTHETQTMTHWDPMLLNEDEWIRTMMDHWLFCSILFLPRRFLCLWKKNSTFLFVVCLQ